MHIPNVYEMLPVEPVCKPEPRALPFFQYILCLVVGVLFVAPMLEAQELEVETNRMASIPGFREASDRAADAHANQLANPSLAIKAAQQARALLPSASADPALYASFDSYEAEASLNLISGDEESAIEKSISLARESNQLLERIPFSDMMVIHNLIVLGNAYLRIPSQDYIANSERAFSTFRRADEMLSHLQPLYPKAAFTDCSGPDVLVGLLDADAKRFYISDTPRRFAMRHYVERLLQFQGKVDRLCSAKSIAAIARVGRFSINSGYASDKLFADTLEQFKDAVSRLNPTRQPYLWADTQRDYGMTLYLKDRLITHHDPQHEFEIRQEALDALLLAESVFTEASTPREWAVTEQYIGDVYIWRPSEENYLAAYPHYLNASMILGKERFSAALIHQNLADSLFQRHQWSEALKEYQASFYAKQRLPNPYFLQRSLQADYEQDYLAYQKAAFSAVKVGEYELALSFLMNADGRGLSEVLNVELMNLPPSDKPQLAKLRATLEQIEKLDSTFHDLHATPDGLASSDQPISEPDLVKAQHLRNQARSIEVNLHLSRQPSREGAGARFVSGKVQREPIVVTAVTPLGTVVLMVDSTHSLSSRNVVELDDLTIDSVEQLAWSNENVGLTVIRSPERDITIMKASPDQAKAAEDATKNDPEGFSQALDLRDDPTSPRTIPGVGSEDAVRETRRAITATQNQLKPLACAIVELGRRLNVPAGSNIHYIGSGLLTMIPLGAAVSRADGTATLDDDYAISFAPNITALLAMKRRTQRPVHERYAAVIYDPRLDMSSFQAKSVKLLGYKHALEEEDSLDVLIDPKRSGRITDLALAMHGQFERVEPWASRVTLSGKDLTMAELDSVRLPEARLVVLSSCETGIKGFEDATTESVGFPELFLRAGAANVVATLWRVDDFATAILLAHFYGDYRNDGSNPSRALQTAKVWLKSSTRVEIASFVKRVMPSEDERVASNLQRFHDRGEPNDHPFEDPYYWAGFTLTGY